MKKQPKPQSLDLENNKLWQQANEIAEHIYSILHELPDDEKWASQTKLRSGASELLWSIAQALGGILPVATEYDWSQARKQAAGLKTMYRFVSARQKFIEMDPQLMVSLDRLIKEVDKRAQEAYELTQEHDERELERYRERVRLWKKANDEPETKK